MYFFRSSKKKKAVMVVMPEIALVLIGASDKSSEQRIALSCFMIVLILASVSKCVINYSPHSIGTYATGCAEPFLFSGSSDLARCACG